MCQLAIWWRLSSFDVLERTVKGGLFEFVFFRDIASIEIGIRVKNCFVYSWELIGVVLVSVQLDNEELGTAIFGTSLLGFVCGSCLCNFIESVCMSHW